MYGDTIRAMLKAGELKGEQAAGARGRWTVTTPRDEIRAIVERCRPGSGWRKQAAGRRAKPGRASNLSEVLYFAALPPKTRALLRQLAERFSLAELAIIKEL